MSSIPSLPLTAEQQKVWTRLECIQQQINIVKLESVSCQRLYHQCEKLGHYAEDMEQAVRELLELIRNR